MPFCDKLKVCNIHIQKTGGISIAKCLGTFRPNPDGNLEVFWGQGYKHGFQINSLQHMKAKNLRIAEPERFSEYHKFSVVRNPYERAVSAWLYFREYGQSFLEFLNSSHPSVDTQYSYLFDDEGNLLVDEVWHLDNLGTHWREFCRELGANLVLPRSNTTSHAHYSYYITPEIRKFIEEKYRCDFEVFGGSVDWSWKDGRENVGFILFTYDEDSFGCVEAVRAIVDVYPGCPVRVLEEAGREIDPSAARELLELGAELGVTFFDRGKNLSGIPCVEGMLAEYERFVADHSLEYVCKVDCDEIINGDIVRDLVSSGMKSQWCLVHDDKRRGYGLVYILHRDHIRLLARHYVGNFPANLRSSRPKCNGAKGIYEDVAFSRYLVDNHFEELQLIDTNHKLSAGFSYSLLKPWTHDYSRRINFDSHTLSRDPDMDRATQRLIIAKYMCFFNMHKRRLKGLEEG